MFIGILIVCTIGSFGASLASNYKESIKWASLTKQPFQARPTIVNMNSEILILITF